MALGVQGVRVGMWTSPDAPTGCTVVLPPEGSLGAVAVRGAAPGTREAVALGAGGKLTVCHGVVLSGGSVFGLATADGVVRWLAERGIGYDTRAARVPIVGAAIVLDQGTAFPDARPGAEEGRLACDAASGDDPAEGSVGAGTGCTVAKVGGLDYAWRGGQGIAVRREGAVVVGALVVNNAVGEIVAEDGTWVARSRAPDGSPRYPYAPDAVVGEPGAGGGVASSAGPAEHAGPVSSAGPAENTVIGCLVTNARLGKAEAVRVADLAHSGVARAVRPAHTIFDGDALFCLATGEVEALPDLVAALAADVVAEACRRGPQHAISRDGIPGLAGL